MDKMLERAKEVTRKGRFTYIEYARFADDVVVLVDGFGKWEWLLKAAYKRLVEEFEKLGVQMNLEKTQIVNLTQDETFSFLGFDFRRIKTRRGAWGGTSYSTRESTDILAAKAQGCVSSTSVPTCRQGC
ncbi:MAG: RNA-directed DNA polymerase [Desulforhopalus sp.]